MTTGAPLYAFALGVAGGIALAFLAGANFFQALLVLGIGIALIVIAPFLVRYRALLLAAAIVCASVSFGIIRADYFLQQFSQQNVLSFVRAEPVQVTGVVVSDPDRRENATHINVRLSSVGGDPAAGNIVAYLPPGADVSYHDAVELRGRLEAPQPFMGDAGSEFDYAGYLQVQNVSAVLSSAHVVSDAGGAKSFLGALYAVKSTLENSVNSLFAEPEQALISGMLFGDRHALPADLEQTLVSVGLIHIVILAGYALSLVADAVSRAARVMPKRARYPATLAVLLCYILMTGAAPATVRAGLMAAVAILARMGGRTSIAMRSLALVAAAMVLWNPPVLLNDSSFAISVAATFGLITLGGTLEKFLRFIPEKLSARHIAASTLSVQLFALPALLYFTGTLSAVALPANLLALPALPFAMLFSFLAAALNLLHPALAFIPALIAHALVGYMLAVANFAASIPWGSTVAYALPLWPIILLYIPLTDFALALWRNRTQEVRAES